MGVERRAAQEGGQFREITVDAVSGKELDAGLEHIQRARDDAGSSVESREPMALITVILLDLIGIRFALGERGRTRNLGVGGVTIGINMGDCSRKILDQFLAGGRITTATNPAQEGAGVTIQHFPDPERLLFFKRKWCISSISTSTGAVPGVGAGV